MQLLPPNKSCCKCQSDVQPTRCYKHGS